ncbi:MFS transporter [Yinghuangia aomiensis]
MAIARAPHPEGTRARWFVAVAVLVLLTEQTALAFTLIAPALIGLATEFQTTQVIWVLTIFTLVGSVVTPIAGKLGDKYGKKKVLVHTSIVAAVGGVISALAPNFETLLIGRALMGTSVAFLPVTFALIRDVFPENYRNVSLGIATNGAGIVSILGPFLAGHLIDNYGHASVFWFSVVITTLGAAGTIALVPETHVRTNSPIDVVGALGLGGGVLLIMLGLSQLQTWSLTDVRTIATLGGGIVVLVLWWKWEAHVEAPFIDTQVLSSRPVATVTATYAFVTAGIAIIGSFLPGMLQTPRALGIDYGFGLGATDVALYIIPGGVMTIVTGLLVGTLAKRFGFRAFLLVAPFPIAIGGLGFAFLMTESWMPILSYGIAGIGAMIYAAGPGAPYGRRPAVGSRRHRGHDDVSEWGRRLCRLAAREHPAQQEHQPSSGGLRGADRARVLQCVHPRIQHRGAWLLRGPVHSSHRRGTRH